MLRRYMYRLKFKYIILAIISFITLKVLGVFTLLFEKDFYTEFKHYPYEGNIQEAVYQLRNQIVPTIKPINSYEYSFIHNASDKCKDPEQQIRIVYVVKSDPENFNRREVIRTTWGFQRRFSDVEIRTVFTLGYRNKKVQKLVNFESKKYSDIIQANFTDDYFNNTIKTMIGLKWVVNYCGKAKFYMFVDDDYYVSTKNVLRFLRYPTNYPKYLQEAISNMKNVLIKKRQVIDFELPDDVKLYTGYVFKSKPLRHIFSKWYISLEEYPYHMWPPYVTAGAFILSREALLDMYYTSFYVKHFRFDDIYIAMLALRANIEPFHSDEFHFYKQEYSRMAYTFTIASHGFSEPVDVLSAWNEQKSLGNA